MSEFIYKIKNNKLTFAIYAVLGLILLFNLVVAIFDIFQFLELQKNAVNRFSGFVEINIIAGILNVFAIGFIVAYLIISKRKIKVHLNEKTKSR